MTTRRFVFDKKGPPIAALPTETPRKGTTITGPVFVMRHIPPAPPCCPTCGGRIKFHPLYKDYASCARCPRLLVSSREMANLIVEKTGTLISHCNITKPGPRGHPYREAQWYWHPSDDRCPACDPLTDSFI